jgi:hypothetical protein
MSGATFTYYWSPWDPFLIACFAVFLVFVLVATYRRMWRENKAKYGLVLVAGLGFFSAGLWLITGRAAQSHGPRLVIHPDYLACGSWTHKQVPWRAFSRIELVLSQKWYAIFFMQHDLLFHLDPRYLSEVQWTDWVRSHQRVRCDINGLTENPRRLSFPAETADIYAQVETAWRTALSPWPK